MENLIIQAQDYIIAAGIWGPVVYIFIMVLAVVISPIPSSPLAIFSGTIFGGLMGFTWTLLGATLGALIAFLIARKFGRPFILKIVSQRNLSMIEDKISDNNLTWFIFLLRLPPLPLFDVVSYFAGLTKISLKNFLLATILGLIPITIALTYLGQWAGNNFYTAIIIIALSAIFLFLIKKYYKNQ